MDGPLPPPCGGIHQSRQPLGPPLPPPRLYLAGPAGQRRLQQLYPGSPVRRRLRRTARPPARGAGGQPPGAAAHQRLAGVSFPFAAKVMPGPRHNTKNSASCRPFLARQGALLFVDAFSPLAQAARCQRLHLCRGQDLVRHKLSVPKKAVRRKRGRRALRVFGALKPAQLQLHPPRPGGLPGQQRILFRMGGTGLNNTARAPVPGSRPAGHSP